MSSSMVRAGVAVVFLFTAGVLAAQEPVLETRSGYGTEDLQVVTIPFSRFQPFNSTTTFSTSCCLNGGERWPTAGVNSIMAEIDAGLVPNGADLEQIAFFVSDTNAGVDADFRGQLCRTWTDVDGQNLDGDCPFLATTSGSPGETIVGGDPDLQVLYQTDVDTDGTLEDVSYIVNARFGNAVVDVFDGSIRLRSVRLLFRRRVSPAPGTSTFGDVPTGHPFFQFVEALAASGITAGCGSGNYCPDAPLTRGQMAVFLAKALGLHWPAP
jgi:S-layer family protein